MANTPTVYKRLPGRSRPYFGLLYLLELIFTFGLVAAGERTRLYLGPGHILVVRRRFFTETLHRFYFADIQALVVKRTPEGGVVNGVLVFLMAVSLGLFFLSPSFFPLPYGAQLVLLLLSAGLGTGLAVNVLLGPVCTTELITAVHRESLPCLSRWRTAQRALALVIPQIQAVQGPRSEQTTAAPLNLAAYALPACARAQQPPETHDSARIHEFLFWLYLLIAASSVADLAGNWAVKNFFDTLLFLLVLVLACIAMLRQRYSDIPPDIRALTGFSLAVGVAMFYGSQMLSTLQMFWEIPTGGAPEPFQTPLNPENPIYAAYVSATLLLYLFTGLLGLMGVYRFRRQYRLAQRAASRHASARRETEDNA